MCAMCVTIRLEPTPDMERRLRELSKSDRARALGWRFEGQSRLWRHGARMTLHACELLADDADWDAPTWSMSSTAAEQLAESFEALLDGLDGDVAVEALAEGDRPTDEKSIGRPQFVDLVRGGSLGTHTRYLVSLADRALLRPVQPTVPMAESAPVTGIREPPADWPGRHLKDDELRWFAFDPSGLAEFVRQYGSEPDLAARIMVCRRAAWACGSYVQFTTGGRRPKGVVTAVVSNEDYSNDFEEYAIDVEPDGRVVGVELLHRDCYEG